MADLLPPVVATLVADIKQYSAKMDEADRKMTQFGAASETTGSKVMGGLQKASTAIIGIGVAVAAYSVKAATNFQSLTTALVTGAGESEKNLKMVSDGILAMAGKVGQTPAQLAQGLYMIESAGYHGSAGLTVLQAAAEGAAVGSAQMETVANALTTAMHDFNIPVSKANNVTSALIETVASGKTHLQDLASSMGKVMPVASALGVSMQGVLGAMATMTNSGLSARLAAMGLQNTLMALSAPSKKAEGTLNAFGLSSQQVKNTMNGPGGLSTALQEISLAVGRKFPADSVNYAQAMRDIFGGTVGFRTEVMLTGSHIKEFNNDVKNIGATMNGSKTQVQGFALVQKDLAFQLKSVSGSLQAGAISLGQWLLPKITDVAKWFGGVVNFLKGKSILSSIASDAVIGLFVSAVVLKLGKGITSVFSAGASLIKGIAGVVGKVAGTAAASTPLDLNTAALNRLTLAIETNGTGGGGGGIVKDVEKVIAGAGPAAIGAMEAGIVGTGLAVSSVIAGLSLWSRGQQLRKKVPALSLKDEKYDIGVLESIKNRNSNENQMLKQLLTDYNSRVGHNKSQTHKTVVKVKHHIKVH